MREGRFALEERQSDQSQDAHDKKSDEYFSMLAYPFSKHKDDDDHGSDNRRPG